MTFDITASIVLFRNDRRMLREAIDSFLRSDLNVRLYLLDNSPDDSLKDLVKDERCEYRFNNKNLGFGKAHNIALKEAVKISRYHIVLNPDVYFEPQTLNEMVRYMDSRKDVGLLMPKILYPDNSVQFLCKLLPTPMDLIGRRFLGFLPSIKRRNINYELRCSGYTMEMNVPYLSGCFMFLRSETLKSVGYFDERIFMYAEDADLTRRIHQVAQTIYYPNVSVFHHYAKGSYKSFRLMFYNIHGAAVYFNKWGWFLDKERNVVNKRVLTAYCN
jgi:GT2 family glycosyltransferase